MRKKLLTTNGYTFTIDQEDFEKVYNMGSWCYSKKLNQVQHVNKENSSTTYLSRLITGCDKGLVVDHKNHDNLDYTKENLRVCTIQQNIWNSKPRLGSSRYKGVKKVKNKWRANICCNKKRIHIGYFNTEEEAAKKYDEKAKELFGEYAYLNFREECEK